MVQYSVPWKLVYGLWPDIVGSTRHSVENFTAAVVARMDPPPLVQGTENLPADPRFLLVANHYQRKGMWILHPASAITQVICKQYGAGDPPVRWVVTGNWPPFRIGRWKFASPGDILLPRVAHSLWCYPVPFAGADPASTARSIRRILRDAPRLTRPIGLFPEGVAGVAGKVGESLTGVERLIGLLAKTGMPVVPVGIGEAGRLVIRIGGSIAPGRLLAASDAARLVMESVRELV